MTRHKAYHSDQIDFKDILKDGYRRYKLGKNVNICNETQSHYDIKNATLFCKQQQ